MKERKEEREKEREKKRKRERKREKERDLNCNIRSTWLFLLKCTDIAFQCQIC